MNGTKPTLRRAAFSAALLAVLAASSLLPATASADAPRSEMQRAVSHERAMLRANGGARLTELSRAVRPLARADADDVTVASRSVAPATAAGMLERSKPAAPEAPAKLDFAALDAMPSASGDAQWQCLAAAIYFESRGEPIAGQIAVAEVVLNRVDSRQFPKTVCSVTTQGAGSGRGCQFSYACDGRSDVMKSAVARGRAEKLAAIMLAGRPRTVTDGATHFHATHVRPGWAGRMTRTASIGAHRFYRQGTQVASR
jgi:spore germination cell wall hydrolase CwlJ-like protein